MSAAGKIRKEKIGGASASATHVTDLDSQRAAAREHEVSSGGHDGGDGLEMLGGRHRKVEEGEGPWLVSYADMMTLLMGFFALIASFSKPDAKEFEKVAAAASEYFGGEYQAPYEQLAKSLEQVVKENKLENQVKINKGPDGVTMTFTGTLFFDSGGFQVKSAASGLMDKLIVAVKKETRPYNALIEGHTDNLPINDPIIASNWELSAIRAARIAQLFEHHGFKKNQLTIMGWGETRPVAPNEADDGTPSLENRSRNRRVVIRLYKDLPK